MRPLVSVVGPALLVASAAGCRADECPAGLVRCTDNVAETCWSTSDSELSGHTEWGREACGARYCQVPPAGETGPAFCALEPTADPRCPRELDRRDRAARCEGNTLAEWSFGFRVAETACASPITCVDITTAGFAPECDDVAFCSPLPGPDPLCRPGVTTACADDSTIVYCRCGFRTDAHACASPGPSCTWVEIGSGIPLQGACR